MVRSLSDDRAVKTWMAGTSPAMTNLNIVKVACSPQRLQFVWQGVGPLRDVAGAEADDEIAAGGSVVNQTREIGGMLQCDHLAVAMRAQAEHEMIAVDAVDRRLAGRIDFGDDNGVSVVEAGAEFLKQRLQPGEAMRLYHGDDLAARGFSRRPQHGGNLDRVMAIVIDNSDTVPLAGFGEAPLDAAKAGDRLANGVVVKSQFMRHRDRGRGIER